MLFNERALIFTFSGTQVRIAEIECLQSLFKMSMGTLNNQRDSSKTLGLSKHKTLTSYEAESQGGRKLTVAKFPSFRIIERKFFSISPRPSNEWNKDLDNPTERFKLKLPHVLTWVYSSKYTQLVYCSREMI